MRYALIVIAVLTSARAATAQNADDYRGGWRTDSGEAHTYEFSIRGTTVRGIYCTYCADATTLAFVDGTFGPSGITFEVTHVKADGSTAYKDAAVAKFDKGRLIVTGTSGARGGGTFERVLIKDPRGPDPIPAKVSVLPKDRPSVPGNPQRRNPDGADGLPYIQPGPWKSKLTEQDVVGVWLGFGVGAPKQYFIIKRVGSRLRGMVCGTCDNPYTMAALDDFRIEGDTLKFNILHEDWGDGEIPTFEKHVTAHVGWNEMRCTTAADHMPPPPPPPQGRVPGFSLQGPIPIDATSGNVWPEWPPKNTSSPVVTAPTPPLVIAQQGYFFVGGTYFDGPDGRSMSGQMYVEFQIPATRTHPYPLVMFSGGGQSGLNYTGTPDGREGWMQYFLRQGYAVYVLDQPSRARSPHQAEVGPQSRGSTDRVEQRFTAPERSKLWPQAALHTQWPGTGVAGDPVFDQFYAQNFPSLTSFPRQQELNRDAGAALLDRIGPAILLTHSQSGTFGWLVADARPALVKGIVALEPSGPPLHDNVEKGAPDWFADGPLTKPYGLTAQPLSYDPPVTSSSALTFVRQDSPDAPNLVRCWTQTTPARRLVHLQRIPILVVQAEASYHAAYDHCTVAYLRQAGVTSLRYVRLADEGITGNGHMLMLEKNSLDIAALIARWLKSLESAG